jgi:hypothetical protein
LCINFDVKGNTSPSNEFITGHQTEDELNNGLERLIELVKLFQLHSLRKRFINFLRISFLNFLFRLETIKQSRQRSIVNRSILIK